MCFAFVYNSTHEDNMGYNNMNSNSMDNMNAMDYDSINERLERDICEALKKSFLRASKEDRLVEGLLLSAQILDEKPDEVMYCILPADTVSDITLQLHIKLMEAFCVENEIPLVKVNVSEKLSGVLPCEVEDEANSCFLIKYPVVNNEDDDDVLTFYQDSLAEMSG